MFFMQPLARVAFLLYFKNDKIRHAITQENKLLYFITFIFLKSVISKITKHAYTITFRKTISVDSPTTR